MEMHNIELIDYIEEISNYDEYMVFKKTRG